MIHCKELNKNFETKEELFKELRSNKDKIINIKKKTIYTSYNILNPEESKQIVFNKGFNNFKNDVSKSFDYDDDYYCLAVNTTNILDSHNDLHVKGIWNKSAKEQSGKNYLVDTHSLTVKDIIVYPNDIEIMVKEMPFSSIGVDLKGNTEALIYKFKKDSIVCDKVRAAIENNKPLQASVKMQYVTTELAMDSDDKEDVKEKQAFEKYSPEIANIDSFEQKPFYFFIQKEAKNIHESSLVLFGSNYATGMYEHKENETSKDTQNKEDVNNTSELIIFFNNIKF